MNIKTLEIGGKIIKVFEDHAVALKAWAEILLEADGPMLLLTLDSHTDTRKAFSSYACRRSSSTSWHDVDDIIDEKIDLCNVKNPKSLDIHIQNLKNDEHISAAIRLGLFDAAIVLAYNGLSSGTCSIELEEVGYAMCSDEDVAPRPHTYEVPEDKIFYLPNFCAPCCQRVPHDDECTRVHADHAIESDHLKECLSHADEMIVSVGRTEGLYESDFILDIDLDYFTTEQSLRPKEVEEFHRLVKAACAITIATEPSFVESMRQEDETITADFSLKLLLGHIRDALTEA